MKKLWDLSRIDVVCLLVYCGCRCKGQTALETQSGNTARTSSLCVSLCVYFGLFFVPHGGQYGYTNTCTAVRGSRFSSLVYFCLLYSYLC